MMFNRDRAIPALMALAVLLPAASVAKTLEVGAGKTYDKPSAAAKAAGPGDTIHIADGEYYDCMILAANDLTIEGSGPGTVLTDTVCAGKALIVADGNNLTVRNLTLTRARVPEGNGAGIRAEGGNLTISHVQFINNQNGILAAPLPTSTITITDSLFDRNGTCQQACAHGIYVSQLALLHVERTRIVGTKQGHGIKSRAKRTEVIDSTIEDGPDGTASYLIELPNGGSLLAQGNTLEKGPNADNHTAAIVIGTEGVNQPTRDIVVRDNTFRNDGNYASLLVYNVSAADVQLIGNKISGQAKPLQGDGTVK